MPRALLELLLMKFRATIRRALRVQRNPKRLALLILGVAAIGLWLTPMIVSAALRPRADSTFIQEYAPLMLAAFALLSLLAAGGESAIAFQPAEVDILFPAPFSRRQLLAYKLLSGMLSSLIGALMFSIAFLPHAGSWPVAFVGILLALWFIQFFSTGLALLKQIIGELAYTRARRFILMALFAGAAILAAVAARGRSFEDIPSLIREFNHSTAGTILLAPFRVFTNLIASRETTEIARRLVAAVALDAALAMIVLRLDTDYLEASIRASERFADRLKRARSGNFFAPRQGLAVKSRQAAGLARFGGAGVIAWRHAAALARGGRRWVIQITIALVVTGVIVSSARRVESSAASIAFAGTALAYLTFMLTAIIRFDFRADLDHIETLKSLPLDPRAIALGELVLPTVMISAVHFVAIAGAAWVLQIPRPIALGAVVAVPVINLLLIGVENTLFLLFPVRLTNRGVGDFSLLGRHLLLLLVKLLVYGATAAVVALLALGIHSVTGSVAGAYVAGWLAVTVAAFACVYAASRAFRAFDVSSDMPA